MRKLTQENVEDWRIKMAEKWFVGNGNDEEDGIEEAKVEEIPP